MVVKDNNVICDYCGKVLFKTNQKGNGHIAFQAKERGFVIKHTLFYGDAEFKIFCDKECCRKWFDENVPVEKRDKGKQEAEKFIQDIKSPKSIKSLQIGMEVITKLFKHPEQLQILLQKARERKK